MAMRVLVLGGEGMLGHKICQCFRKRFETWCTILTSPRKFAQYEILEPQRVISGVDVRNFDSVIRAFAEVKPQAVVNCIGIIKQLKEAKYPIISLEINSLFPHRLAKLCQASGTRMFHVSTDCVFSGRKGKYTEEDVSDAEDLYGRSKYMGEVHSAPGCITLRTSIIGREINSARALFEWFLSNRGGKVHGYKQVDYTGFTTTAFAEIIGNLLEKNPNLSGLYQVSSDPISKFDLLTLVNEIYSLNIQIEPDTETFCDRSLDSSRFRKAIGFTPPTWREMITQMYQDPTPYDLWRQNDSKR